MDTRVCLAFPIELVFGPALDVAMTNTTPPPVARGEVFAVAPMMD
ncbi:MAG: hypothetical protein ACKVP5_12630 [Aestuariivirga sp.]